MKSARVNAQISDDPCDSTSTEARNMARLPHQFPQSMSYAVIRFTINYETVNP